MYYFMIVFGVGVVVLIWCLARYRMFGNAQSAQVAALAAKRAVLLNKTTAKVGRDKRKKIQFGYR